MTTQHTFSRALSSYEVRFSRGPVDPTTVACTCCRYEVETVDSRGRCDDCAPRFWLAEGLDDVTAAHQRVALDLGAFSFAAHAAVQLERDLCNDPGFVAWMCDRAEASVADAQPVYQGTARAVVASARSAA